jgi:hypothetical protein
MSGGALGGGVRARRLRRLSVAAAVWALLYGLYRAYYGLGGTIGMAGEVRSEALWRAINLIAAALLVGAAILPIVVLPLWRRAGPRRVLLATAWIIAVGCVMHGLIDDIQRILSLAGLLQIPYPDLWLSRDERAADLQDLLFNETWFIVEGLLWGAIAWTVLGPSRARRWWTATAVVAVLALTVVGLLSALGITGRLVIG